MCRIDLCGQIRVKVKKWSPSHFMKMRSLKLHLGADSPTRGYYKKYFKTINNIIKLKY